MVKRILCEFESGWLSC